MLIHRRLIAALTAVALGWSLLTFGVVAPAAYAAAPPDPALAAQRAPHDPSTYYAGTEGLSGATLAAKLHTIISGPEVLTRTYAQVFQDLAITDADPDRPGYLIDFYAGTSNLITNRCGSSCGTNGWNREHTWPQSHGDFGTSAGIGTDLFHMRPEYGSTNSSRSNKDFDNGGSAGVPLCADCRGTSTTFEPRAAVKGDLARGLFFMAVRYEGDGGGLDLKMNDLTCNEAGAPNMGKLSTLVAWALADPPDDRERTRNDLIDSDYQHNRNPFIDHPEWVTSIFGNGVGAGPACGSTSGTEYLPGGTGPVNAVPTTAPMSSTTAEDTTVTIPLAASDTDGDPLTWTVRQTPARGTASISGTTLTYVPAPDASGTEVVGVQVADGRGGTAQTTVTISVTPVNDAPVALGVTTSTPRGSSVPVALLGTDVDGDALTYTVTQPAHGSVTLSGTTATYTPSAGYQGPDSFTFTVADAAGARSGPATVSITVTAAHAPAATPRALTVAEDNPVTAVLAGTDSEDHPLTYALVDGATHGTVTLATTTLGTRATYVPDADFNGDDAFTFTVSDDTMSATSTSAPATVSLTVTPVNDAPLAGGVAASTTEDGAVTVMLDGSDVDGDELTYAVGTPAAHGTVGVAGDTATYTPDPGFSGTDTFTYTASDAVLASAPAPVTVTVTAVQRAATLRLTSTRAVRGGRVTTTVRASGPTASVPTGTVTLRAAGRPVGTASLSRYGAATIAWTPTRAGATSLVARYSGDAAFLPETSPPASLVVARSAARTTVSATPLRRGRPSVVKVSVRTVARVAATGRVTVTVGGVQRAVRLVRGVATVRITRLPRTARVTVVARYAGDRQYVAGSARRTFALRR